ncbi:MULTISPECIES: response regulator [Ramlibacter]|uniref:Response regulator n=1 Tax=Ramlibacter pinisoli TaxID=2682844 RepID=A0A6N8IZB6_9BURK|nr:MULTISPECIES: response regulator [Ramlibacter]MBA2961399.1 response regulator [Ramlibacter sp. CGMCC 1.13660]MVQ31343.1 response regulator [Ramlibacter pinisoli]
MHLPASHDQPRRVLIVDDDEDFLTTLADLLRHYGHEVLAVGTGEAALAATQDWVPHLVLLDLAMPGLNGYDTALALRADARLHDTMIVAVSGFGSHEERDRAAAADIDLHLVKPISLDEMERVLALTGRRPAR